MAHLASSYHLGQHCSVKRGYASHALLLLPLSRLNGNHYWVARHYKWALQQVFDVLGYEYIIILGMRSYLKGLPEYLEQAREPQE
jgi:hypothetical protein